MMRDDHGISRLSVVSWRVSRTGRVFDAVRESLDVSGGRRSGDRAERLDAEQRGLLPGDTLRLYVEALDKRAGAACRPQRRDRVAAAEHGGAAGPGARRPARSVSQAADSLSAAQRELSDRTRDLAQERSRDQDGRTAGRPDGPRWQSTERHNVVPVDAKAEEIARDQARCRSASRRLAQAVGRKSRAPRRPPVWTTARSKIACARWQELLQRALTPELEQRLRELQEALARLDPEATRQALQRLAEAQQELRRELERSQELFKRAALEGELASLAKDAEDLQRRQTEWTRKTRRRPDAAAAAASVNLAAATDSLAKGVETCRRGRCAEEFAERRAPGAARDAGSRQRREPARLARCADVGTRGRRLARAAPECAAGSGRDSLAADLRQETVDALNRALAETAALARRQQEVGRALRAR